ncbi:EamA family transporter [Dyella choica]|uniref:EamA family transporter n=1 Tax=Dyella choica TaxID=1927959 RepID=A0A432M610_9GAMM|nr:EamA family transporter [Dyella choica]RUL74960.1 EamA family transporter [Dyella choica]
MSFNVFEWVMLAALLHASWNALIKQGGNKLLSMVLVANSAALLAAFFLPVLSPPARASWPFILSSTILQIGYFVLLAQAYRVADLSQAYPLMRGTAPLLVAVACACFLRESLRPIAWTGIAVICIGILSLALPRQLEGGRRGIGLALLNAVLIAGYTLVDGIGVKLSGAPAAYTLWIFLLTGIPLAAWALLARRAAYCRYMASHWRAALAGGIGTTTSYALVLGAMTTAPIAMVAALRETSILFAAVLSGMVLKESLGLLRLTAICIIAVGAMVLRLA